MGGIVSKQGNYTFHPLRKKTNGSDKSNENNNNNDRVITDCTPSAKLFDNNGEQKEGDHQSLNIDKNNQSISHTTNEVHTSEINSDKNPQSISTPRKSISYTTNVVHTSEINIDKNPQSISSPRQSISSPRQSISSPRKSISNTTNVVDIFELNSDKNPQSISSPRNSISNTTNIVVAPKKEQQNLLVSDSDNNTPKKESQDENNHREESDDDDYGRRISARYSDYDGWVGSPSFREYCVKDHFKPDSSTYDGEKIETKTKAVIAKEDPTPVSARKGRTTRRIKKVISMGNPAAMKNLFHASACYSPGNSASHNKLAKPIDKPADTK